MVDRVIFPFNMQKNVGCLMQNEATFLSFQHAFFQEQAIHHNFIFVPLSFVAKEKERVFHSLHKELIHIHSDTLIRVSIVFIACTRMSGLQSFWQ